MLGAMDRKGDVPLAAGTLLQTSPRAAPPPSHTHIHSPSIHQLPHLQLAQPINSSLHLLLRLRQCSSGGLSDLDSPLLCQQGALLGLQAGSTRLGAAARVGSAGERRIQGVAGET